MQQDAIISPETAAFLQLGVSVRLASSTAGRRPVTGRGMAVTVEDNRCRIRLIVASAACRALLEAVRTTGFIAAAFTQPTTHRSIQLKGGGAVIVPLDDAACAIADRHCRAFALELREVGFSETFIASLCVYAPGSLVGICFTPDGAFDQTP
ncbi:MAG: hypothetical protein WCZ23_13530, partial [Rhodospirillaceae bacterium]